MTQQVIDTNPIEMPTGLEFIKGQTNKTLLRAAWKTAGLNPAYPVDTRAAFALLKIMGYRADSPRLDYHLSRCYIEAPRKVRGEFRWTETDIIRFADSLESTKNWLPMHPCHSHKLSGDLLTRHIAAAASLGATVQAFERMPEGELLSLLVSCSDQDTRELIASVLKKKSGMIHLKGSDQVPDHDPQEVN